MSTREGLKHDRFLWCSCALARIDSSDCRTDRGTIARTSTIQWPRTRVEAMDECVSHRNRPELALPGTDHPVTSELASNESVDRDGQNWKNLRSAITSSAQEVNVGFEAFLDGGITWIGPPSIAAEARTVPQNKSRAPTRIASSSANASSSGRLGTPQCHRILASPWRRMPGWPSMLDTPAPDMRVAKNSWFALLLIPWACKFSHAPLSTTTHWSNVGATGLFLATMVVRPAEAPGPKAAASTTTSSSDITTRGR